MINIVIRKILHSFAVLLGVATATFFITTILPGDPAKLLLGERADTESSAALRKELGLDKPISQQYLIFLGKISRGDFGRSFSTNREVSELILERLPATLLLATSSMLLAVVVGISLGIISSLRPNTFWDYCSSFIALLGISLPSFVVSLLLAVIFGSYLGILPLSGYINRGIQYLILPSIALGLRPTAVISRLTRSSMLETSQMDFVRTARAKGISEFAVVRKHILRNALVPVVTSIGSWFASLLAGTFFVEYMFNWPGIGLLLISSIEKLDFPLLQAAILLAGVIFVITNIVIDIVYSFLDPRIRVS